PAPPATRAATRAGAGEAERRAATVLRRPLALVLVAAAAIALGGLGWTLLRSPADPTATGAPSVLLRPRATSSATTASPSARSTATRTGDAPLTGRDPFADEHPVVPTAPTTPPHVESTTATTTTAPAPSATSSTPPGQPGSATVTVTVSPTFVGLYAWNGSRASFRVNARTYSVHVGTTFGPGLRFTAVVPGTPQCARVQHLEDTFTLCPGQFTTLPS
ncbi:MAG TPA: hypothetical protein VMT69_03055, partial [Kineosporiaceae bacterium]|nr:hypothetical protein [Kineosporiaceae bacterium]